MWPEDTVQEERGAAMEVIAFVFGFIALMSALSANAKIAKLKSQLSAAGVLKNDQS
jgi:hypothetical protein